MREAHALAGELSHPLSQSLALFSLATLHVLLRGESQAALEGAEAAIALASEGGFREHAGRGILIRAAAWADQGRLEEGIAGMRAVRDAMRAAGLAMGSTWTVVLLAGAHAKAGQVEEGLALVAEAQESITRSGERFVESELHRVKGDLLLAGPTPDPAQAEAAFREALEIARRQSTKSHELRAATGLARLWQQQGRVEEARALLAPVYGWFTEGFDTRDLKDATALLEELA